MFVLFVDLLIGKIVTFLTQPWQNAVVGGENTPKGNGLKVTSTTSAGQGFYLNSPVGVLQLWRLSG